MRIAEIAPVWFAVPPTGYGGIELVVALLADGLVEHGHDVTLFASGGSRTKATLVSPLAEPPDPSLLGSVWYDAFHATASYLHSDDFDVIHDHSGIIGPAIGAVRGRPPVVHTLHGPWTGQARAYYELIHERLHLVAISEAQRADGPDLRYAATVHNGIDLSSYGYRAEKDDFLVYIGRANPDKGPVRAIEIARRAGRPLKMILKRNEPPEREYYTSVVEPMLGSDVEVVANIPHDTKVDLLGRARAMIFPIQWMEPFGLVMTEAMACGTPVVTTNWGAAPELVDDGVTGFRRDTDDELVEALARIDDISPEACRDRVERLFSAEAMVRGYEQVFSGVLSGVLGPNPRSFDGIPQ
ncbi:MAG: glycosyltransferase family 4 protein [Acidimicrobiia bacterium]